MVTSHAVRLSGDSGDCEKRPQRKSAQKAIQRNEIAGKRFEEEKIKKSGKKQRMTQGIVEGLDGRVREVVASRIGEEIGVVIDEGIDERVGGGIDGGINEELSEGFEEMCVWGGGETVMGGQEKGASDDTIRCLCTSETKKGEMVCCDVCGRDGVQKEGIVS